MNNTHDQHPTRRDNGVLSRTFDAEDGTILLDVDAGTAHRLEPTAAAVWSLCDGTHSVADIAASVGSTVEMVEASLSELSAQGLLEETDGHTRRSMLVRGAKFGATVAVAVPLVETLVLPTAFASASTLPAYVLNVGFPTNQGTDSASSSYSLTTDGSTVVTGTMNPTGTLPRNSTLYVDASGNIFINAQPSGSYVAVSVSTTSKNVEIFNMSSGNISYVEQQAPGTSGIYAQGTLTPNTNTGGGQHFQGNITINL